MTVPPESPDDANPPAAPPGRTLNRLALEAICLTAFFTWGALELKGAHDGWLMVAGMWLFAFAAACSAILAVGYLRQRRLTCTR